MNVLLPKINEDGNRVVWKPMHRAEHMSEQYKLGNKENMLCFINKSPEWNNSKSPCQIRYS